ncbi:unnamed protein product [Ixodes pacificus]
MTVPARGGFEESSTAALKMRGSDRPLHRSYTIMPKSLFCFFALRSKKCTSPLLSVTISNTPVTAIGECHEARRRLAVKA